MSKRSKPDTISTQPIEVVQSLELFGNEPLQASINQTYNYTIYPTTTYENGSPISFKIPKSTYLFTSPRLWIEMTVSIKNADLTDIADKLEIAPVACLSAALFSDIEIKLNGAVVSQKSNLNGYMSYLNQGKRYFYEILFCISFNLITF